MNIMGKSRIRIMKRNELSIADVQGGLRKALDWFTDCCEKNNIEYFLGWGNALGYKRSSSFIPWDDDVDVCMLRADFNIFVKLVINNPDIVPRELTLQTNTSDNPLIVNKYSAKFRLNGVQAISDDMTLSGLDLLEKSGPSIDLIPIDRLPRNYIFSHLIIFAARFFALIRFRILLISANQDFVSSKFIKSRVFQFILIHYERALDYFYRKLHNIEFKGGYYPSLGDLYPRSRTISYSCLFPSKTDIFEGIEIKLPNEIESYLEHLYGKNYKLLPAKSQQVGHWNAYYYDIRQPSFITLS